MYELFIVGFDREFDAEKARFGLMDKQAAGNIDIEDAVVISKGMDNNVTLNQDFVMTEDDTILGSWFGMLTGLLLGAPLGSLGAVLGMTSGATTGALLGAADDLDLEDAFKQEVSSLLRPGKSALAVLLSDQPNIQAARDFLKQYGGKVIATSLPADSEKKFKKAVESKAGLISWKHVNPTMNKHEEYEKK